MGCLLPSRVWAGPPLGGGGGSGGNGRAHRWLSSAAAGTSTRPSVFSSSAAVAGCGRDGRAEECRRFFWLLKIQISLHFFHSLKKSALDLIDLVDQFL